MEYWSFVLGIAEGDSELAGGKCHALGAEGVVEQSPTELLVYVGGDQTEAEAVRALIAQAVDNTTKVGPLEEVPQTNWLQQHPPILEPVKSHYWTLTPFAELPQELPELSQFEIATIPGMGFGTGHHASTRLALDLLFEHYKQAPPSAKNTSVLDVGTGNGILAIAAERLIPSASITATDIDANALENAKETAVLNKCNNISFIHTSVPEKKQQNEIILANLYAECLVLLADDLTELAAANALLVLSGIMAEKAYQVEQKFSERWSLADKKSEPDWTALAFWKKT